MNLHKQTYAYVDTLILFNMFYLYICNSNVCNKPCVLAQTRLDYKIRLFFYIHEIIPQSKFEIHKVYSTVISKLRHSLALSHMFKCMFARIPSVTCCALS